MRWALLGDWEARAPGFQGENVGRNLRQELKGVERTLGHSEFYFVTYSLYYIISSLGVRVVRLCIRSQSFGRDMLSIRSRGYLRRDAPVGDDRKGTGRAAAFGPIALSLLYKKKQRSFGSYKRGSDTVQKGFFKNLQGQLFNPTPMVFFKNLNTNRSLVWQLKTSVDPVPDLPNRGQAREVEDRDLGDRHEVVDRRYQGAAGEYSTSRYPLERSAITREYSVAVFLCGVEDGYRTHDTPGPCMSIYGIFTITYLH